MNKLKAPSSVKILSSKVLGAMPADSRSDAPLVQLAELHRARKSGRLVVARGAQILFVHLRQGQIAGVESESAPEAGGTDPDEPVFQDGLDLGGDPGLARAAARERLLEALAGPEASCAFTEGGTAEGGDPPLELATEEVLAEALEAEEPRPDPDRGLHPLARRRYAVRAGGPPARAPRIVRD